MAEKAKKMKSELDEKNKKLEDKNKKLAKDFDEQKKELDEKNEALYRKNRELNQTKTELESSLNKVMHKDKQLQQVKDKLECPVCMEMPRNGPVPVCPNGHFVCNTCKEETCPTCRVAMGGARSLLAVTIIESIDHKCKFDDCQENFALAELEKHEGVCWHRSVFCPHVVCKEKAPLAKLSEHLFQSKKCCTQDGLIVAHSTNWNQRTYNVGKEHLKDPRLNWPVRLYSFSGELFAVFPRKLDGHYTFVIMMFGSTSECAKFNFEMIVHENWAGAEESEMALKCRGNPLSIDRKENEMNYFEASEQFMNNLMSKSSVDEYKFSLSFKISKK